MDLQMLLICFSSFVSLLYSRQCWLKLSLDINLQWVFSVHSRKVFSICGPSLAPKSKILWSNVVKAPLLSFGLKETKAFSRTRNFLGKISSIPLASRIPLGVLFLNILLITLFKIYVSTRMRLFFHCNLFIYFVLLLFYGDSIFQNY